MIKTAKPSVAKVVKQDSTKIKTLSPAAKVVIQDSTMIKTAKPSVAKVVKRDSTKIKTLSPTASTVQWASGPPQYKAPLSPCATIFVLLASTLIKLDYQQTPSAKVVPLQSTHLPQASAQSHSARDVISEKQARSVPP